jgi:hypothetical protein
VNHALTAFFVLALLLTMYAADRPLSDPAVGTVDTTGKLVIHVFYGNRAHLSTDYGVVMCRSADNWVLFTIADKAKNSVREFSNYDDYLAALSELPKGSTLTIYDRCLMPQFYDFYPMHHELYQKFSRDCHKRGLKLAKEPKITCTCKE